MRKPPQVIPKNGKRAAFHRKLRQYDLRERIFNANLLNHIDRDLEKVCEMAAEIPDIDEGSYSAADHRKFMAALNAAKIRLNARFKLLDKIVPDARDSNSDDPYDDPPELRLTIVRD
jgi:hypothetical protein